MDSAALVASLLYYQMSKELSQQAMVLLEWVPAIVVAASGIITIARQSQITKDLGEKIDQLRSAFDISKSMGLETHTKLESFYSLEEERHSKQDIVLDEVRGDIKRQGRDLYGIKAWQAGAAQVLKIKSPSRLEIDEVD